MFDVVPEELQLNITSNLSYGVDLPFGEVKVWDEFGYFDDLKLSPSIVKEMLGMDVNHDLNVNFNTRSNGQNYADFNNITFVVPQTPTLNSALSMGNLSTDVSVYGPDSNAYVLNHMDEVQIVIFNWDAGKHPFHLHGHHFQVVHKSQDVTSDDPEVNPPLVEGLANPMRRDTVTVPPGGSATLRFRADNPGAWFLHCRECSRRTRSEVEIISNLTDRRTPLSCAYGTFLQFCLRRHRMASGEWSGCNLR